MRNPHDLSLLVLSLTVCSTTIHASERTQWLGRSVAWAGDVDGDGSSELLILDTEGSSGTIWVVSGSTHAVLGRLPFDSPRRLHTCLSGRAPLPPGVLVESLEPSDGGAPSSSFSWVGFTSTDGRFEAKGIVSYSAHLGAILTINALGDESAFFLRWPIAQPSNKPSVMKLISGPALYDQPDQRGGAGRPLAEQSGSNFGWPCTVIDNGPEDRRHDLVTIAHTKDDQPVIRILSTVDLTLVRSLELQPVRGVISSLSALDDINDDGIPDLAMGVSQCGRALGRPEYVRAVCGRSGATLWTTTDAVLGQENLNEWDSDFGSRMTPIPDFDGDEIHDLLVSAESWDMGAGGFVVLSGSNGGLLRAWKVPESGSGAVHFASSIAVGGDWNDDSIDDWAVGSGSINGGAGIGAVFIYSGSTGDILAAITQEMLEASLESGREVTTVLGHGLNER